MRDAERSEPLRIAERYFQALMANDRSTIESLLAPEVVHEELPNRLNPRGTVHDRGGMLAAFDRGTKMLADQRYEVERAVVQGETVALEVMWTGTLAMPVKSLAAGDSMRARFAVFLDVRAGRIVRQRNYDCFDEF